ncbi:inner membrane-spanning protein YciB [uncultured Sphingomonas sp.]|uniref:inner membrane-spanning protein YciB n=1 Tax=uncultured Sphingomonas sp. TaxID=158754 RepID=UPI002600C99F|nr:inner membrane-spanning protein YciB [uncultured Sphingomonas sp.]
MSARNTAEPGIAMRLALDLGPLAFYFAAYSLSGHDIFLSTALFMGVTAAAMLFSLVRFGKVSPIQVFSAIMVLLLGGLTIWLHQDWIIKVKPTVYYVTVAAILFWGLATRRPTLQMVLGQAYPGLTAEGWRLLTRNWAGFFLLLAIANELVWRNASTEFWLGYKLWGSMPATMLFAAANIPMLMRHGLAADAPDKVKLPPEE